MVGRLRKFFDSCYQPSDRVLLCGDFNVAPEIGDVHDPELWRGRILFSSLKRRALSKIKNWGLV